MGINPVTNNLNSPNLTGTSNSTVPLNPKLPLFTPEQQEYLNQLLDARQTTLSNGIIKFIQKAREIDVQIARLNNKNPAIRKGAIQRLGELKAPMAVGPLTELLLSDGDRYVRIFAARALALIGGAEAEAGMIKALNDKKFPEIRWAYAEALGDLGATAAIKPLVEMVVNKKSKGGSVRHVAIEALGKIVEKVLKAPSVEPELAALLKKTEVALEDVAREKSADILERGEAIRTLGKFRKNREVSDWLLDFLKEAIAKKDGDLMGKILLSLGQIGNPDPNVKDVILSYLYGKSCDKIWSDFVMLCLGRIFSFENAPEVTDEQRQEVARRLTPFLASRSYLTRMFVCDALGRIGVTSVKPALEELLIGPGQATASVSVKIPWTYSLEKFLEGKKNFSYDRIFKILTFFWDDLGPYDGIYLQSFRDSLRDWRNREVFDEFLLKCCGDRDAREALKRIDTYASSRKK